MKNNLKKIFFVLLILRIISLNASEVFTLPEIAVKAANSPAYRKIEEKTISARSALDAQQYYFLPKIYLTSDAGIEKRIQQSYADRINSDIGLSLKAEQPLPAGSSLQFSLSRGNNYFDSISTSSANLSIAYNLNFFYKMGFWTDYSERQREYQRKALALKQAELDYQYELIRRFYSLFQAQSILKLENIGFTLSEKNYLEAANKFKAGIIPEVEILQMELFLKRKELALKQAVDNFDQQKADFMSFCALVDTAFVLEHQTGLQKEFICDQKTDLIQCLESSVQLQNVSFAMIDTENGISDIYRNKFINGDLNVGISALQSGKENEYYFPNDSKQIFGRVSLKIPLYQRNEFTNALDYAKTAQKISVDNFEELKRQLINQYDNKIRELKLNFANLQIAQKNLELSEKIFRISQSRFNNGLITSKDLIQNQIDYFQSEQSLVNAEIDYILSIYSYKKLVGMKLLQ